MLKHDNRPYWPVIPAALALAGILVFIFATYGPPASSSGYVSLLKGVLQKIAPDYVAGKAHYQALPGPGSWLMAFVLGMSIGGFIAGRTFKKPIRDVPEIWEKRFGQRKSKRYLATFIAGFLILFASRLAGGCTLGLFISSSVQLGISGLYFGIMIFTGAVVTAKIIYGPARTKG